MDYYLLSRDDEEMTKSFVRYASTRRNKVKISPFHPMVQWTQSNKTLPSIKRRIMISRAFYTKLVDDGILPREGGILDV